MAASDIVIRGAREHNLRDVSLSLPRNRLICFTGVSGSGKSSLAFDTLYAEGQRRYVESLSSFARQFLGQMPKPDVDSIDGLSPSISISQKTAGQSPRSTVGTITEIYDYLRVLYARVGTGHCPECGRPITAQTRQQILDRITRLPAGTRFLVLAPLIRRQKGEYRDLFEDLQKQGFVRARVDGTVVRLSDDLRLDRQMRHNIEVVIDRLVAVGGGQGAGDGRLAEAVELALRLGQGNMIVAPEGGEEPSPQPSPKGRGDEEGSSPKGRGRKAESGKRKAESRELEAETTEDGDSESSAFRSPISAFADIQLSAHYACTHCQLSFEPPSPQMFSFNSPQGMCPDCGGLGEIYTFDPAKLIPDPSRSFQQGCIEMIGHWRDMGRWRRHIYRGVAETLERKHGLPPGTVLETAWEEVDPKVRDKLLWGTGDEHVTFTWRSGPSGSKWGGKYEGIIPRLLSQYRTTKSRIQRRGLEKYMRVIGCAGCGGQRLNAQARAVTLDQPPAAGSPTGPRARCRKSAPWRSPRPKSSSATWTWTRRASRSPPRRSRKSAAGSEFLKNVGLDYLTLDRTAPTLSGGEMQRIPPGRADRLRAGRACCTSSTSRRSACTPATTTACWRRWPSSATRATPWSSSSTTKTRCGRPTTSSISGPARASAAATSWPRGPSRGSSAARKASPANISPASGGSRFPSRGGRPTASSSSSAAPPTTTSRASTSRSRSGCSSA